MLETLKEQVADTEREGMVKAYRKNVRPWRSIFNAQPVGWGRRADRQTKDILASVDSYVQTLNDSFAKPSGEAAESGSERAETGEDAV